MTITTYLRMRQSTILFWTDANALSSNATHLSTIDSAPIGTLTIILFTIEPWTVSSPNAIGKCHLPLPLSSRLVDRNSLGLAPTPQPRFLSLAIDSL